MTDKGGKLVNFYHLLGVGVHAPTETIATMIKLKRLQNQIPVEVLDKAEVWLLNTEMRQRYDSKLRQKQPDVFMQTAVTPRQTPLSATFERPVNIQTAKPRKVGRWYLLGFIIAMVALWYVFTLPILGLATPASWQAIGLKELQTEGQWHRTPQALYLTEQHQEPQWLWVWQQDGSLALMPLDGQAAVCTAEQNTCHITIQLGEEKALTYPVQATEHTWMLQSPADTVALSLRLQQEQNMTVTWQDQERPVTFQAAMFPNDFLIDGVTK